MIHPALKFKGNSSDPVFLSLETAQYCMARIVDPLMDRGFFQAVKIDRNRLYSQIIDNLNKSSINGLALNDISRRLQTSIPDPALLGSAFHQVQECALHFRTFCLENNLVDYSLLIEIAREYLFAEKLPLDYLFTRFKVLIADNIEEDTPFAHSFFRQGLGSFSSTTLVYDQNGGFRTFLGADAENAYGIKPLCEYRVVLHETIDQNDSIQRFRKGLLACIDPSANPITNYIFPANVDLTVYQYLPEMIDGVIERVEMVIQSGTPPEKIAVLSPYLSDVLKFTLTEKLNDRGIPSHTHRPSRMYLASSAIQAVLTLARIAHPAWELVISHYEFRDCLMRLIPGLDLIRAEQAAAVLLGSQQGTPSFRSFDTLTNLSLQECITFATGQKLENLAKWIDGYRESDVQPLDVFIQHLFGEILSQPEFALHNDLDAANEIARLIQSIRLFRTFSASVFQFDEPVLGKAYIDSVNQGLLPSSFAGIDQANEGVLIAPAHTFLMQNRPVDFQFWLDIGSLGWWERLYQPLTNPYVYQSGWSPDSLWSENREYIINQTMMAKLVNGLLLRCQQGVFASVVQTNEYGTQNSGPLLRAFQKLIKNSKNMDQSASHV